MTDLKTFAIIQARRAASRLPDKVLLDIAGEPMLVRVVERTRRATALDGVVVATTTDPYDDAIEALCQQRGYAVSRGSMYDVLDRYYQAARFFQAGVIVRITADCPLIDPDVIDETVWALFGSRNQPNDAGEQATSEDLIRNSQFLIPALDFTANRLPPPWKRTFPIGLDTEVVSIAALARAWKEATQQHQREHVLPYLYDDIGTDFDQPSRFRVLVVDWEQDLGDQRWTVDTPQDLELVQRVFAAFGHNRFGWLEVLELLQRQPELAQINAAVPHKTAFDVDPRAAREGKA